jgi:hypothetical protein
MSGKYSHGVEEYWDIGISAIISLKYKAFIKRYGMNHCRFL